jgi:hypothetical protein
VKKILKLKSWKLKIAYLLFFFLCFFAITTAVASLDVGLMRIWKDGKLGLANASGKLIVPARYISASKSWSEGFLWVATCPSNLFSGTFLDSRGKELFTPAGHIFYDDVMRNPPSFKNGWACVGFETETGGTSFSAVCANGEIVPGVWNWWSEMVPLREGDNIGFINLRTGVQLPSKYQDAKPFAGSFAPVKINGKWGVVDKRGDFLAPAIYDEMAIAAPWDSTNAVIIAKTGERSDIIHQNGDRAAIDVRYTLGEVFARAGVAEVSLGGKVGLVDIHSGETVVKPKYDAVDRSPGRQAAWMKKDGKLGMVKYNGGILQPFKYDYIEQIIRNPSSLSEVWLAESSHDTDNLKEAKPTGAGSNKNTRRITVVNGKGETLFSQSGVYVIVLENRFLRVREESGEGLWDLNRREYVIEPVFEVARYSEALRGISSIVGLDGKRGLANLANGDLILPCKYDRIDIWGYKSLAPGDLVENRSLGLVEVWEGKNISLFSAEGTPILTFDAGATELPDYLSLVNRRGKIVCKDKVGLINSQGRIVLECLYEDVGHLSEGVAPAKQDGLWGYVDVSGKWEIAPGYEAAGAFLNGYAAVKLEGKTALISREGKTITPFKYNDAGYVQNGRFPASKVHDGKELWGIVDLNGDTILPIEYDAVEWIDIDRGKTQFHGNPGWGIR